MKIDKNKIKLSELDLKDTVIKINRVVKVVKGGRTLSFNALVVVGDPTNNVVGYGFGKAKDITLAVKKAGNDARKKLIKVPIIRDTIPHGVKCREKGSLIMMKRAAKGTGIIAGGGMRAVLESAGVKNVLAKSRGSSNAYAVVKNTYNALKSMRTAYDIASKRGISVERVYNG